MPAYSFSCRLASRSSRIYCRQAGSYMMRERVANRVFITAAEASGDQNAAALIRSLKTLDPTIEIEGLGGPKMAGARAKLLEDTVEQAAMGWRGVLRAFEARRWLKITAARYREAKP